MSIFIVQPIILMERAIIQIQDLLTDNKVEPALRKLHSTLSLSGSELVNDVILLTAQFKKLNSDVRRGIVDYSQETLRYNRILNSILSLVDEMKEDPAMIATYSQVETELDQSVTERGSEALSPDVKDSLFERMSYVKEKNLELPALWIDDQPAHNRYESNILQSIGVRLEFTTSSQESYERIGNKEYELILSDIARNGKPAEGLAFHQKLIREGVDIPLIFYAGTVDRERGVPPYAFGIADLPNELIHLVLDVIERKY